MNLLITGGAGYIGSHVAMSLLKETKYNIFILDNLSASSLKTVEILKRIRDFEFIKLDLKEFEKVNALIKEYKIDIIMHFAACTVVSESIENPLKYYMNNTVNTANLIKCANDNGVNKFIFSSTAAVYAEPKDTLKKGINEEAFTKPINPYGMSKLMSEQILQDSAKANKNLKYIIFRYFNVAGASEELIGEKKDECKMNLIPLLAKTALGKKKKIMIFGDDYPTHDGTSVRDYVHVLDLVSAHIKAIRYLDEFDSDIFNIGYGKGFSVKEVIDAMKIVTQTDFSVQISTKRTGDLAVVIADNSKIKNKMNWAPKYDEIKFICKSAYNCQVKID